MHLHFERQFASRRNEILIQKCAKHTSGDTIHGVNTESKKPNAHHLHCFGGIAWVVLL